MQHSDLVEKYNRAQRHFEKGNYRRAKWLFKEIVYELSSSDTDSMAGIALHNYSEDYLERISEKNLAHIGIYISIAAISIILTIIYFIIK
jgi:hypothetical protein